MTFTKDDKYIHSVLDTVSNLNSIVRGSMDGFSDKEIKYLYDWLKWRITEAWDDAPMRYLHSVDHQIKYLAYAVLDNCNKYLIKEPPDHWMAL